MSRQFDSYDFPGGGININETIENALKREFFEETGLIVQPSNIVHVETTFFTLNYSKKHEGQHWNCPLLYYLVDYKIGEINIDHFDENEKTYAQKAEWIKVSHLNNIHFVNGIDSIQLINKTKEIFQQNKQTLSYP